MFLINFSDGRPSKRYATLADAQVSLFDEFDQCFIEFTEPDSPATAIVYADRQHTKMSDVLAEIYAV